MPGAPASGGAGARCTRPQAQATSYRSCWITSAGSAGMSITWWEAATPSPAAAARSAPHSHRPAGKCGTDRSGCCDQARCEPGAPAACRACARPLASASGLAACGPAGRQLMAPSRSSRCCGPAWRCSCPTSSASATRSAFSSAIACPCSAISSSRAAQEAQPGAAGGRTATISHHHRRPSVVNTTRRARPCKIATQPDRHITPRECRQARNGSLNVYMMTARLSAAAARRAPPE